jgi:hypothetical protein
MKPDFQTMSKSELKAYLIQNRNDTEAFHALIDRINAEPDQTFYSIEQLPLLEQFIQAKQHQA